MNILEILKQRIVFFDGGTGSLLQANGLKPGELPEIWNIKESSFMVKLHREYLEAGCDIIKTNTFGANGLKFNFGTEYTLDAIVTAALDNAKAAIEEVRLFTGRKGFIALDLGPTGKLLKPLGDLGFEEAYQLFSEVVTLGAANGADLILIETMSDSYEAKAAVLAAKENSNLPVFVTMIFDEHGKLLTGGNIGSAVALLEGLGVDALGLNCGLGPIQMRKLLEELLTYTSLPIIVNPNAGLPHSEHGQTIYDINELQFAEAMEQMVDMGVRVAGGCCGTTPEHIRALVATCKEKIPVLTIEKNLSLISSYAQVVRINKDPIIIGERINPTGKSKFKQALKNHNLEYILREGLSQQEKGAHILDVNVGLPGIDEPSMMVEVIRELQSIIDLPLQIDTSNLEAMEHAMRIYNGKPMINSVNGKQEVMEQIFPLIKKYGGVVVALALDENGIPESSDGRIEIAKKIYAKAKEYGIHKKDIIIDALAMTISSDNASSLVTLDTLKRIREELDGISILGVSNISFGLPQRDVVNATFFTMAMQNGLNAAIINPNSDAMMKSYYGYRALSNLDKQCMDYISWLGGQGDISTVKATEISEISLSESIEKGLKERASSAAKEQLEIEDALVIVHKYLIPALDKVGKGFEKGSIFLPQLLMSAEAAKAAFSVINDYLLKSGTIGEKRGKIVLATVKGDIHDIGKNIVKVLLENYSYDVIDLGKDVPPSLIVETVIEKNVPLVGLSALMTTTVPSMEETIRLLHQKAPHVKVMVGGAVLTPEYAKTIGADAYCKDAMASVNYAEQVFCIEQN